MQRSLIVADIFHDPNSGEVVKEIVMVSTRLGVDDLVFEIFASSGASAQAVIILNAEDCGNQRFILAQLAEA